MISQSYLSTHILSALAAILFSCDLVLANGGFSGGSGYGGGGYYRGGNYYYDYDDSSSSHQDDYTVYLFFILSALGVIFRILYKSCLETGSDSIWAQKTRLAEVGVISDAALHRALHSTTRSPFTFPSATFRALYTDNSRSGCGQSRGYLLFHKPKGNRIDSMVPTETTSLTRQAANSCPTISGLGRDSDGGFSIVKGMVSPISGKCFWIEKSNQGRRQVLVTGSFHMSSSVSFQGRWIAQNGNAGFFSSFDLIPHFDDTAVEDASIVVRAVVAMPAAEAVPINDSDCESAVPIEVDAVDRADNDCEASSVQPAVVEHGEPGRCYEVLPDVMDGTGYEEFHDALETTPPRAQAAPAPVIRVNLGYGDPVW